MVPNTMLLAAALAAFYAGWLAAGEQKLFVMLLFCALGSFAAGLVSLAGSVP